MATYVSNRDSGGRTDEEGHYKFWNSTFIGHVLRGQEVVQNSPTTNMNVRVSEGVLRIPYSDYAYQAWSEGYTLVPVSTADPTNPRVDRLVAYIDRSMILDDSYVNNPGVLKYKAVTGSPNAVPSPVNDAAVDTAVSNNPWVELAEVTVPAAATQILTANIADTRLRVTLAPEVATVDIAPPAGVINDFAGSTAPSGWLLCYGQAISRTTYSALYSVIGTLYRVGDGSTTFNLPDCRGRVSAGKDNMGGSSADRLTGYDAPRGIDGDTLGQTGGQENHSLTVYELANHAHGVYDPGHGHNMAFRGYNEGGNELQNRNPLAGGSGTYFSRNYTSGSGTGIGIYGEGGNGAHNNVQPTIIFNKIIKT